ncbi:hypothetical protein Ga0100231_020740 [Opitutaceae bacterium TAV4]|nr:hypothetical protein Ga0100231_020740 [Opitutaceae bacterium TAV4]RRK00466.1 hypothetical protein Ga0100230_021575 [Opitutaceae bacterium TAV3]
MDSTPNYSACSGLCLSRKQRFAVFFSFLFSLPVLLHSETILEEKFKYKGWFGNGQMSSVWTISNNPGGELPLIQPKSDMHSSSYLQMNAGVLSRSLGRVIDKSWRMEVEASVSRHGRVLWIALLDDSKTRGYGLVWEIGNSSQGYVKISKYDGNVANLLWNSRGSDLQRPISSGYVYSTQDPADKPFARLILEWDADSSELKLSVDGYVKVQAKDDAFSSFSTVAFGANTGVQLDNLRISTFP